MNKQEFIDKLRAALNGRVSPSLVTDNVNYYEEYINMEIRKGRSEAEVLQMLGDPRLIAKTIIETSGKGNRFGYQEEDDGGSTYREAGYAHAKHNSDFSENNRVVKNLHMPGWLLTAIVILGIVLIFSLAFSVLYFLVPIIIPVFVVMFLVKLFRDWLN